ncbi:MAG TPA: hypothetical protein VGL72_04945 [Bryobacteraceae bacterium]|jgi:hypothetical protein
MAPATQPASWKWWAWKSKRRLKFWTNACLVFAGLVGLALAWFHPGDVTISVAWASAALATGSVLGFLFGIPGRSNAPRPPVQRPVGTPAPTPTPGPVVADSEPPQPVAESNLVQVSDWMTKLLLGGGLTQLQQIPKKIWELAGWVAIGIDPKNADPTSAAYQANQIFASGLLVYFFVLGFFGGYFITQLQFGKKIRF